MLQCVKQFLLHCNIAPRATVCGMRIIKKYGNRRLYDTEASTYINLRELAELIRQGEDVQVVAVQGGADLTRAVLLQVLLEVQGAAEILPPGLLHRIIRMSSGGPLEGLVRQQLGAGQALLDPQLTHIEHQLRRAPPGRAAPPPPEPETTPKPDPEPDPGPEDPELDALRARLQALEARLAGDD